MTARKAPRPDGKNVAGNGKGLKKVTRPTPKKRGKNATEEAKQQRIAQQRASGAKPLSNMTVAEVEALGPEALDKPLTEKAKLFVKFWAQGETIYSASAKAGYGDGATYAYKLVHHPAALALYHEEKRKYEEACQMTRKRVMDGLLEGIEMAKLMSEPASIINGWKTIGQMCGYFEPVKRKVELTVKGNVTVRQMQGMTDAELLKAIQEGVTNDLARIEHEEEADGEHA